MKKTPRWGEYIDHHLTVPRDDQCKPPVLAFTGDVYWHTAPTQTPSQTETQSHFRCLPLPLVSCALRGPSCFGLVLAPPRDARSDCDLGTLEASSMPFLSILWFASLQRLANGGEYRQGMPLPLEVTLDLKLWVGRWCMSRSTSMIARTQGFPGELGSVTRWCCYCKRVINSRPNVAGANFRKLTILIFPYIYTLSPVVRLEPPEMAAIVTVDFWAEALICHFQKTPKHINYKRW